MSTSPLRVIFAGTPDFAATHLNALIASHHEIVGVFTQPDRPAGRGNKLTPSPVKCLAQQHNLPLFQPATLKTPENQALVTKLNADIMIVVAYGLILPQAVLSAPRFGCFNVHGSLLPRWRGAAPIQRAIWAGDNETGITIMQMDAGLDTGDMLLKVTCPILAHDTSASLYNKLAKMGPDALLETLHLLQHNQLQPEKQQDALATYAKKLSKEEALIDWSLSAIEIERCIRAFNPWPVSYIMVDNQPIKVWQANVIEQAHSLAAGTIISADKNGIQVATAAGILNMTLLQPAGKKAMSTQDLLNSKREWFIAGHTLQPTQKSDCHE